MRNIKGGVYSTLSHFLQLNTYAFTPLSINLDITWSCNLNCTRCSVRQRVSNFKEKQLSPERFKYILSQLPRLNFIYFMGIGEPLMNPYFFDLLGIAQSKNINASLITNGMLLNKDNIKRLNDNLLKVYVSIDTASPEKFEMIRKGAKFPEVLENMHNLKKAKPNVSLGILAVLMKETIEGLPDLVRLAKDLNADYLGLNHILALDERNDRERLTSDMNKAKYYLEKAQALAKKYKIEFVSRPLQPRMRRCWQPWFGPLIMLNGDVYPCCFMDQSPEPVCTEWYSGVPLEVPFRQYKMGNIFENSFKEVWNSKDFRMLRKTIRDSKTRGKLTIEEFNLRRRKINLKEKFSYCRVCLWRWSIAC